MSYREAIVREYACDGTGCVAVCEVLQLAPPTDWLEVSFRLTVPVTMHYCPMCRKEVEPPARQAVVG